MDEITTSNRITPPRSGLFALIDSNPAEAAVAVFNDDHMALQELLIDFKAMFGKAQKVFPAATLQARYCVVDRDLEKLAEVEDISPSEGTMSGIAAAYWPDASIPSSALRFNFNAEKMKELTQVARRFVIAHEIAHVINGDLRPVPIGRKKKTFRQQRRKEYRADFGSALLFEDEDEWKQGASDFFNYLADKQRAQFKVMRPSQLPAKKRLAHPQPMARLHYLKATAFTR